MKNFIVFIVLSFIGVGIVQAHPTSYEGGFSLMGEMSPRSKQLTFIYSPYYWLGLGAVVSEMRADEDDPKEESYIYGAQIGWLAKRWNLEEAQANLYFVGGPGWAVQKGLYENEGLVYRYGVQADYETRRIFTFVRFIEARYFKGHAVVDNKIDLAVGFAPYLAEFKELNSWFILEASADSEFEEVSFTPTLKFFYKNYLWTVGQSLRGATQLGFMVRI